MNENIHEQLALLRLELAAYKASDEGRLEEAASWLQMKVDRQAKALALLNRRIYNQRFQLRTLNKLGRGLTKEEWLAARESKTPNPADTLLADEPVAV